MVKDPRIVFFDLETLPNLYEVHKVIPGLSSWPGKTLKAQINSIICCGYKVLGENKTHCLNAWDFSRWEKDINDDYTLLKEIVKIMKTADAIVTHNGKRFDWKFFQTRLLLKGLDPMHDIPYIDTCQLAKRNITMDRNSLNTLGEHLVGDTKLENGGWDLWQRIQFEDNKADRDLMEKYCKQDVDLLEKVFIKLRPFAKNIPNYNMWRPGQTKICPSCGSTRLKHNGYRNTKTMSYKRLRCMDCGSSSRTDMYENNPRSI